MKLNELYVELLSARKQYNEMRSVNYNKLRDFQKQRDSIQIRKVQNRNSGIWENTPQTDAAFSTIAREEQRWNQSMQDVMKTINSYHREFQERIARLPENTRLDIDRKIQDIEGWRNRLLQYEKDVVGKYQAEYQRESSYKKESVWGGSPLDRLKKENETFKNAESLFVNELRDLIELDPEPDSRPS